MCAAIHLFPRSIPPARRPALECRYRDLLGPEAWSRLPATVRHRFSRRLAADQQVIYRGDVVCMELSRWGWVLAQAARLMGAPLPFTPGAVGPTTVVVSEAERLGGQIWSRSYPRPGAFPQVIHSLKRFAGPTGLEEDLGHGLLMRLTLHEEEGRLVFRSAGYAVRLLGRALPLPRWLWPGACTVTHRAETDARFSFSLTLDHARLGRLVHQVAFFEEV